MYPHQSSFWTLRVLSFIVPTYNIDCLQILFCQQFKYSLNIKTADVTRTSYEAQCHCKLWSHLFGTVYLLGGMKMATGGHSKRRLDKDNDVLCNTCFKNGENTKAGKYCALCVDFYCENCFEKLKCMHISHSSYVCDASIISPELCPDHPGKVVEWICTTHDEVGCETCVNKKHAK